MPWDQLPEKNAEENYFEVLAYRPKVRGETPWKKLSEKYDKQDYFEKLMAFPKQCREGWKIGCKFRFENPGEINKIFITGMGGSGYVGELIQKFFFVKSEIPVFVEHGYIIPKFVDEKTLYIIISHSGNTEEPLTIFNKLQKRNIPTIGVGSGGKLKKQCKNFIEVPSGLQPRQATGHLFFSTLAVLENLGLSPFKEKDIFDAIDLMEREQGEIITKAKDIAIKLQGKTPMVYATEFLGVSALRWQTELNEIAKAFCHWNIIPEMQHNEINASFGLEKAHFVILKRRKEKIKVEARVQYMHGRIANLGYELTEVEAMGKNMISQVWYTNYLGSMTAFYLSMLNHRDPTPVNLIGSMKRFLQKQISG